MTRLALLLAAGAALCGCVREPFVQRPPARYQGETVAAVETHRTADIPAVCDALHASAGRGTVGCFARGSVHLPNPCSWPDPYAQLFCHELGHANGWPGSHPSK